MKQLTLLLLAVVASAALAQEPTAPEKGDPVYLKTTPHPVIVPEDVPVKPVIKPDAAPRKSTPVAEQNTKAQAGAGKQAK